MCMCVCVHSRKCTSISSSDFKCLQNFTASSWYQWPTKITAISQINYNMNYSMNTRETTIFQYNDTISNLSKLWEERRVLQRPKKLFKLTNSWSRKYCEKLLPLLQKGAESQYSFACIHGSPYFRIPYLLLAGYYFIPPFLDNTSPMLKLSPLVFFIHASQFRTDSS